jgi:hypothetical protein
MFYTDIFIEVAVPFPRCRSGIPVRYAEVSYLEVYLGWFGFPPSTLVTCRDPVSFHFFSFVLCTLVCPLFADHSNLLFLGYCSPAGLARGVEDPFV